MIRMILGRKITIEDLVMLCGGNVLKGMNGKLQSIIELLIRQVALVVKKSVIDKFHQYKYHQK